MELLEELEKYDPDFSTLSIEEVDFKAEVPYVIIHFEYGGLWNEEDVEQRWKVKFKGFKKGVVSDGTSIGIDVETEHALLWEYQDTYAQLYFYGVPGEVYELYWELAQVHNELFENYVVMEDYLNVGHVRFDKLMRAGAGLLAKGPRRLMERYGEVLEKCGVKGNVLDGKESEVGEVKVMFVGRSYVVAEGFESERLA